MKKTLSFRLISSFMMGLCAVLLLMLSLHVNFQQQLAYSPVTRVNASGIKELMIFRDYKEMVLSCIQDAERSEDVLSCL